MDDFQGRIMAELLIADASTVPNEQIIKYCDEALQTLGRKKYVEQPWMEPLKVEAIRVCTGHPFIRWLSISRDMELCHG